MMQNVYHGEIMELLLRCGRGGMHVADISKYVYNMHAGLFNSELSFDALHQTLRHYLWRQSRLRRSPFRKAGYGIYAIKDDMALQLDFVFDQPAVYEDEEPEVLKIESPDKIHDDPRQLLLFPDLY